MFVPMALSQDSARTNSNKNVLSIINYHFVIHIIIDFYGLSVGRGSSLSVIKDAKKTLGKHNLNSHVYSK